MQNDQIKPIAKIRGVSKKYQAVNALDSVDLQLFPGEVLAILGPNGAGKTTLINILLGKLSVNAGDINVFGLKPGDIALKRLCGAMLQVANLPETLSVREHINLFQSYYVAPMAYSRVIEFAGLQSIENRLVKGLSGGQKQRLLFALAICGNPKLLFLDEPSVGMDISARQQLWSAIKVLKNQGTSIVLTTHYLEEADKLADRVVMLNKGQIIQQGTPQAIKSQVLYQKIRFVSSQAAESFNSIDSIQQVRKVERFFEVDTLDPVACLKQLFALVDDMSELTVSGTALEDAFLQLNQQNDALLAQNPSQQTRQSAA